MKRLESEVVTESGTDQVLHLCLGLEMTIQDNLPILHPSNSWQTMEIKLSLHVDKGGGWFQQSFHKAHVEYLQGATGNISEQLGSHRICVSHNCPESQSPLCSTKPVM